jgi:hypothetical protein
MLNSLKLQLTNLALNKTNEKNNFVNVGEILYFFEEYILLNKSSLKNFLIR